MSGYKYRYLDYFEFDLLDDNLLEKISEIQRFYKDEKNNPQNRTVYISELNDYAETKFSFELWAECLQSPEDLAKEQEVDRQYKLEQYNRLKQELGL